MLLLTAGGGDHGRERQVTEQSYVQGETEALFLNWAVGDLLRNAAEQAPQRIALIIPGSVAEGTAQQTWTYQQLRNESQAAARALLRHFEPGDRIATWAG